MQKYKTLEQLKRLKLELELDSAEPLSKEDIIALVQYLIVFKIKVGGSL